MVSIYVGDTGMNVRAK